MKATTIVFGSLLVMVAMTSTASADTCVPVNGAGVSCARASAVANPASGLWNFYADGFHYSQLGPNQVIGLLQASSTSSFAGSDSCSTIDWSCSTSATGLGYSAPPGPCLFVTATTDVAGVIAIDRDAANC